MLNPNIYQNSANDAKEKFSTECVKPKAPTRLALEKMKLRKTNHVFLLRIKTDLLNGLADKYASFNIAVSYQSPLCKGL